MSLVGVLNTIKLTSACFFLLMIWLVFNSKYERTRFDNHLLVLLLLCPLLLVFDAGSYGFEQLQGASYARAGTICTMGIHICMLLVMVLGTEGIISIVTSRKKISFRFVRIILHSILTIEGILLVINPFTGILYQYNNYHMYVRGPLAPIPFLFDLVGIIIIYTILVQNRRLITNFSTGMLSVCLFLVLVTAVIQLAVPGFACTTIAICFSIVSLMVSASQRKRQEIQQERLALAEQERELARQDGILAIQEAELAKQREALVRTRTAVMRSQIKPHFIFNSLTVVRSLISENPKAARSALQSFATFLRKSFDTLDHEDQISFREELELVRCYVTLEQLRFPGLITLKLDVETYDFKLPMLTVQPLVENAIRYGIRGRSSPGTVTITVRRVEGGINVAVSDDGIGFNADRLIASMKQADGSGATAAKPDNAPATGQTSDKKGGNGIAMSNICNRLALVCGGTIHIESTPGEGTCMTLFLPDPGKPAATATATATAPAPDAVFEARKEAAV